MTNIAIFASGSGSNAEEIIKYFDQSSIIEVKLILSNKPDAYVLERAKNHQIPSITFDREEFYHTDTIAKILEDNQIKFIVLAGFLWLFPKNLVQRYHQRIINIHPALLPKYGGKGMYGEKVHQAVVENNEEESGITIHYVNEHYDKGNIIFQAKCLVTSEDTPQDVANKIHTLEHEHFPKTIEKVILKK